MRLTGECQHLHDLVPPLERMIVPDPLRRRYPLVRLAYTEQRRRFDVVDVRDGRHGPQLRVRLGCHERCRGEREVALGVVPVWDIGRGDLAERDDGVAEDCSAEEVGVLSDEVPNEEAAVAPHRDAQHTRSGRT